MTGVANAADSIDDLVSFLGGEPDEAHEDEEQTEDDSTDEGEEQESEEDEESQDESESEPTLKFKVPVKNEDGTETVEEIDQTELIAGYQRQKAFTQKTMELAARERQATEIVQQRVTEASQYAMQKAEMAKAVLSQLTGHRSEEEMRVLAETDQVEWVREKSRMQHNDELIARLESSIQADKDRIAATQKAQHDAEASAAWDVLSAKGYNKEKLVDVYTKAMKAYGVQGSAFSKILDPGLVLALEDAIKYRALEADRPQVAKRVKEAERLPTNKKSLPTSERVNKALGEKFSRGRAKVDDLAAFLANQR